MKRKVLSVLLFVFTVLILTSAIWSEGKMDRKKVNLLKWVGPGKPGTFEEYIAQRPRGAFRIERKDDRNLRAAEKVLVIVNSTIYPGLETEILRYTDSLIACGYDAPVYQSSYGTAEDLKNFIKNNQANLIGCVFIGDLPAAWYEVDNDFGSMGYASFPCDLFLMDLDGNWIDSDSNGKYDDHTNGSGDREPEIFVGRIDLSRMSGNEVDNLSAFFNRDNQYWSGNMNLVKYGLTYTEDDWAEYPEFLNDISHLYGSDYQAIAAPNTSESDYRNNRLSNISYEFIQLSCHSSPVLHQFTRGGYCYYYEVQAVPPQFLGINMFCCSSNRFTSDNFLGAAYLHHSGPKALSVIGSTKTGSMLDFSYFYAPLGENKSMGVAFKEWFEAIAPYDADDVSWHYGMAIIGDPMITFISVCSGNHPPTADFTYTTNLLTVDFTDQSTDSDGTIVSWDWDFGDGGSSAQQNPSYTYGTAGTYTVTLTVTDNGGATDSVSKDVTVTSSVPDPPVADFSASSTSIEEGDSVTFTDLSTNNPTSWSWTFEGGTPGTSSEQGPVISYDTAGTYTVSLTASNAGGSDTETKTGYITVTLKYCASQGNDYSYEWIERVVVGSLDNSSGAAGYTDFTSIVTGLTAGNSYNVSLTPGFSSSTYTEYWKIWIDYNVDGDFEDAGEEVFSDSSSSTVTGSFTVPTGLDCITRMRVTMKYDGWPTSCESFTYGEVEDYTVDIDSGGPQYTLTTNTVGSGSITLDPAGGTYPGGTVVTLTANPDSGWQFDGWSGDLTGTANPTTITMDADKTVTATFSEVIVPQYTLTVNTVGQGSVTLDPPGGTYDEGTVVTLTANAASGWQFDNWSGDLTGSTNPASITMDADKTVTAAFIEGACTETVGHTTVFGTSTTTANRRAMPFTMPENGEICSVTMYHTGGSGSMILGVYDGTGSAPQNRLGVTAATAVSGSTGWQAINLTSPAYVAGGSTVWLAWVYESNPGIWYETGSPGRASSSDTWSGGMPDPFGSSSQSNYIYSIYANYTPSAPPQYTLTVNVVGNGTVTLDPPGGTYDAGTVVTLTATADSGWQFDSWSGDLSGSTNPTTITMNSNKTVTVTFSEVGTTGTVGITDVYGSSSTSAYRRAMPFTMPEDGTITSITMYHTGGSGSMIMAVYDGASLPGNRLAITPTTAISGSTGWQTINLTSPVSIQGSTSIWLAWVYEDNPGIRYQTGSPGRAQSSQTWSGGMPDPFGSSTQANYLYSIYATYTID